MRFFGRSLPSGEAKGPQNGNLFATCPIAGAPPIMCHGDDPKFLCGKLIDYAVGEPAKEDPASGSAEDGPERWISQNDIDSSLKLSHKRKSKFDICALGIEGSSVMQLTQRERNDDQLHFNAARTRARASAIGIA